MATTSHTELIVCASEQKKWEIILDIDLEVCTVIFSLETFRSSEAMKAVIVHSTWNTQPVYYLHGERKTSTCRCDFGRNHLWKITTKPAKEKKKKKNSCCSRCWLIHGRAQQSIWRFYCICLFKWWTAVPPGWFVIRKLLITLNNKLPLSAAANKHSRCLNPLAWEPDFNECHIFT